MWWNKLYALQSPIVFSVPAEHPLPLRLKNHESYIAFDHEPSPEIDEQTHVDFILAQTPIFVTYSGLQFLAWDVHFGSAIEQ